MVGIIPSDFIQVIVFSGHPHAFLGVHCPGIGPVIGPQKHILELDHPGIGKQQSLIASGHQ